LFAASSRGSVAQLVERTTENREVTGSTPVGATLKTPGIPGVSFVFGAASMASSTAVPTFCPHPTVASDLASLSADAAECHSDRIRSQCFWVFTHSRVGALCRTNTKF
jgi:hypothetical protein